MSIKININDEYDVYSSGTVISHDNKPVSFLINKLRFRILFVDDLNNPDNSPINMKLTNDGNGLDIILTNYNNILGQGVVRPIEVGFLDNKKLFIQFIVTSMNKTGTRIIHYNWLLKDSNHEEE